MKNQIDSIGVKKVTWEFCEHFPLVSVVKGRRACRTGWRNPPSNTDMRSVVLCENADGPYLGLQYESTRRVEKVEWFPYREHMLATDWFLEAEMPTK